MVNNSFKKPNSNHPASATCKLCNVTYDSETILNVHNMIVHKATCTGEPNSYVIVPQKTKSDQRLTQDPKRLRQSLPAKVTNDVIDSIKSVFQPKPQRVSPGRKTNIQLQYHSI